MPIITNLAEDYTPDIIIIGGGASGCTLAGRLAAAQPPLEVLVLESGPNNHNDPLVTRPGNYLLSRPNEGPLNKRFLAQASRAVSNRSPSLMVANVLGGGSSINVLAYSRASASDYDDWKLPGWSTQELLPLMRRLESFRAWDVAGDETHGNEGRIAVSYGGYNEERIVADGLKSARELGHPAADHGNGVDTNNLRTANGFMRLAAFIDPKTGLRQDSAHRYVHAYAGSNLKVLCNAPVTKVLLSNGRALGAEFRYLSLPGQTPPPPSRIFAKRLVVISAGALSTPCILERSGIGNPEALAAAGISVKSPLEGVGENFQDHYRIAVGYRTDGSYETLTDFAAATGDPAEREAAEREFRARGAGKLATNYSFFGGKVSPKTSWDFSEVGARNADFFARHPDKPAVMMGTLSMYLFAAPDLREELDADAQLERRRLITLGLWTCYPRSTGSVHVLSPDPEAEPRIVTGYLDDDDDVRLLGWGYSVTDKVMMGMKGVTGKDPATHPRNGESLERFVRRSVGTPYHFSGTARMGKAEAGGVLSERLEVHGVEGLMVADLSVCPSNLGADTYHPALLVGEKAADLIAEKLGLDLGIAGKQLVVGC